MPYFVLCSRSTQPRVKRFGVSSSMYRSSLRRKRRRSRFAARTTRWEQYFARRVCSGLALMRHSPRGDSGTIYGCQCDTSSSLCMKSSPHNPANLIAFTISAPSAAQSAAPSVCVEHPATACASRFCCIIERVLMSQRGGELFKPLPAY